MTDRNTGRILIALAALMALLALGRIGATQTAADVQEIRRLLATTSLTQRQIGKRFSVTDVTVSLIARGRTWKNV